MKKAIVVPAVLFALSICHSPAAVKIQGGATYSTITGAVQAAINGAVLLISTGAYHEVVDISQKNLTLDPRNAADAAPDLGFEVEQAAGLAHGFAPEVRHEVRHWLSVISLVSLGQGVALVPAALERVGLPRLQFRPLLGEHPHSEMLALWRTAPASPLVQALLAHLRQAAQGC